MFRKKTPQKELAQILEKDQLLPLMVVTFKANDPELKDQPHLRIAQIGVMTTTAMYDEQVLPGVIQCLEQMVQDLKNNQQPTVC